MGLTLLAKAHMPLHFWWNTFSSAVFLINKLPTPTLHHKTLMELVHHHKPDYRFLKTFGCACFPHLRTYNNHKLAFRSSKCVFIGYSDKHKGYRCLHSSGRIYISQNVIFDELDFPFVAGFLVSAKPPSSPPLDPFLIHDLLSLVFCCI